MDVGMHVHMHTLYASKNIITPYELKKILPYAKNQLIWTVRIDFINVLLHLECISNLYKKTFIKSIPTAQIGWFFACGNISWVPGGLWPFQRSTDYACMHACMHMHACMQISNEASGQSFYMVILYLCAKNWVFSMIPEEKSINNAILHAYLMSTKKYS